MQQNQIPESGRNEIEKTISEKRAEAGRKGGKAAHAKGTAHEFTSDEARNAGRKGGAIVSRDRSHMAEIGRKGGKRSRTKFV